MKKSITNKAAIFFMLAFIATQEVHAIPVSRTTREVFKLIFDKAAKKQINTIGYSEALRTSEREVSYISIVNPHGLPVHLNPQVRTELVIEEVSVSRSDIDTPNAKHEKFVIPETNTPIGDVTEIIISTRSVGEILDSSYANNQTKRLNEQLLNALYILRDKYSSGIVKIHSRADLLKRATIELSGRYRRMPEYLLSQFEGGISANIIVSEIDAKDYLKFLQDATGQW